MSNDRNKERTHDCPKCGDKGTVIHWKGPWLGAACNRCGIKWPIEENNDG